MERHEPHSPDATEPGDHPQMSERKGSWKVLFTALGLTMLGLIGAGFWFAT